MSVDVRDMARGRDVSLAGGQDTAVARKMMIICGAALTTLVAIKLGFLKRVMA